ncbi:IS30 family transposase [Pseudomonas sp. MDT1-85]
MGNERFELVLHLLRERFSPEQIAGKLRVMKIILKKPTFAGKPSIKRSIRCPWGSCARSWCGGLRQGKSTRRPRAGGVDRRGQIPDMVSIHLRPPEVEDRLMPGHWEGDLIKGKNNASAVGTLVERSSGYLMLVKMNDATATSAVEGFSAALNGMPLAARKSMTYDQGKEMARHAEAVEGFSAALNGMPLAARKSITYDQGKEMARHAELTQKTGIAVYFADPHSPWQRGTNEHTNGLVREFLPK